MKRLLVVGVLALMVAIPAGAQAAPFPPRLNFAYNLATDYWGQRPTACASIDKQVVPEGALGNAWVGAISGRSTQVRADAPPGSVSCILWIDRAYAEPIIFDLLCAVMVHHVGHLLGKGYSSDRGDVMHESIPVPGLCNVKGQEATRMYLLRLKYRWLKTQRGARVKQRRHRLHNKLNRISARFWSMP